MINNKTLKLGKKLLDFSTPKIMGIINITQDSFYTESRKNSEKEIICQVSKMLEEGVDLIDIGAQSSRPGAKMLTANEEWKELEFALSIIRKNFPKVCISVDTFWSYIAEKSVQKYNVDIINDISGGKIDKNMFNTIKDLNVAYVLMHTRGTPETMNNMCNYKNLTEDIILELSTQYQKLNLLGVSNIIIDPGFGFAKNLEQNYELLTNLNKFEIFNCPILLGISRKSMIYKLFNYSPKESLNATSILNTIGLKNGANILRVHDVKEAKECIKIHELTL